MRDSPVWERIASLGATACPYGPQGVEVAECVGPIELEYAAVRKGAAVFDQPHRGAIEVRGSDRIDFLQRMLTQDVRGVGDGGLRRSFWLNRKGRIEADLRVIGLADRVVLELDIHDVERTVASLGAYVFTENVVIEDVSGRVHRLGVYGPDAGGALGAVRDDAGCASVEGLPPDGVCVAALAGVEAVVCRDDWCGEAGYEVIVPAEGAGAVFDALRALDGGKRVRPIGWHALNVARIEAGTPIFHLDFGPTSLPAETSLLADRVSFTKGCYLGQEIVARMHALGRPKQVIVGLRPAGDVPRDASGQALLPVTGAQVHAPGGVGATPVGVVTSATLSPMLGAVPICLATVRSANAVEGAEVVVSAEGREVVMRVHPQRRFWPPTGGGAQGT